VPSECAPRPWSASGIAVILGISGAFASGTRDQRDGESPRLGGDVPVGLRITIFVGFPRAASDAGVRAPRSARCGGSPSPCATDRVRSSFPPIAVVTGRGPGDVGPERAPRAPGHPGPEPADRPARAALRCTHAAVATAVQRPPESPQSPESILLGPTSPRVLALVSEYHRSLCWIKAYRRCLIPSWHESVKHRGSAPGQAGVCGEVAGGRDEPR
jgi:hypothetical protein